MTIILFFFNAPATPEIYTLSLHDALPISITYDTVRERYTIAGSGANMWSDRDDFHFVWRRIQGNFLLIARAQFDRSEEHTSELQSHSDLVCRLLLEKKKKKIKLTHAS